MAHKSADYYQEQVQSLTSIPSLPMIAYELMKILGKDDQSVSQILPVIEKDPPLAMKVLKVANSAYYGLHGKVESLHHALVIIGMQELRDLSLGFLVLRTLAKDNGDVGLRWDGLWEHSVAVGHIAQLFQEKLDIQTTSSSYAMGLLHDVGKIILYRLEPEKYLEAYAYAMEHRVSAQDAEKNIIGVDHMTVGGWVAETWRLPASICSAIRFHHEPDREEDERLQESVALIQIADIVANLQSLGFGKSFVRSTPRDESGWKILQERSAAIKSLDVDRFIMEAEDEIQNIKDMVRLFHGN